MISDVIPVFSRKVIFGYEFVAASTVAIALISFGVWAHHMFAVGMSRTVDVYFAAASLVVGIPTGIKMFNWLATAYGGRWRMAAPMLFSLGFLSMFVIGGLTGIILAVVPLDYQLTDSYFVVGHFHWVIVGGILMGLFAGVYYWYPKVTGRMYSERLANWQFWLLLIGFLLTFGPMHVSGMLGMPRRIYTYPADRGWDLWNQVVQPRRLDPGPQLPDLRVEPADLPEERGPGRRRPLGCLDARMGHDLAAAAVQLRGDPDGPQPPAALGPQASGRPGLEI